MIDLAEYLDRRRVPGFDFQTRMNLHIMSSSRGKACIAGCAAGGTVLEGNMFVKSDFTKHGLKFSKW